LRPPERRLVVDLKSGSSVSGLLARLGNVKTIEVDDEADRRTVTLDLAGHVDQHLVARVSDFEDVLAVRWRR